METPYFLNLYTLDSLLETTYKLRLSCYLRIIKKELMTYSKNNTCLLPDLGLGCLTNMIDSLYTVTYPKIIRIL